MNDLPITIPTIPPPTVKVFFKGRFVKECNEYELNDIRIQIKKGQIPGFTMFDDLDQNISKSIKTAMPKRGHRSLI